MHERIGTLQGMEHTCRLFYCRYVGFRFVTSMGCLQIWGFENIGSKGFPLYMHLNEGFLGEFAKMSS